MTPDERTRVIEQLHPTLRGELLLIEDIPHMTDDAVDTLFPNFVNVWRSFLHELALANGEDKSVDNEVID